MKKILLIRLSSLGDVIFNIPLANVLKSNGFEVSWLVSEKGYDVVKEMNEEVLIKLAITSVPQVKVGDKIYDFSTDISAANEWVKNLEARNK